MTFTYEGLRALFHFLQRLIMPRQSEAKRLAEKFGKTMQGYPMVELWAWKHIGTRNPEDKWRKAFDIATKGTKEPEDEQETD